MNYLILNNREYFQNKITFDYIKEVSLNGRERCDGLFGEITKELLEETFRDHRRRDEFFETAGLCGDRGLQFVVFKIPQDLLYYDETELIPTCFEFINENDFSTQVWSYCYKNTWEYFLIGINKSHGINYIFDIKIDSLSDNYGVNTICKKIEEVLFK